MDVDELTTKLTIKSRLRVAACHRLVDTPDSSVNHVVVCSVDASRLARALLTLFTTYPQTLLSHVGRGIWTVAHFSAFVINDAQIVLRGGQPLIAVLEWFCRSPSIFTKPRILAFSAPMTGTDTETMERLLLAETAYLVPRRLRPIQVVVKYEPTHTKLQSKLIQNIYQLDPSGSICKPLLTDAHYALEELGCCASDLVWRRAWKEVGLIPEHDEDDPVEKRASEIRNLIDNWDFSMPNTNPSSRGFNLTSKFSQLIRILKAYRPCGDDFRGIILGEPLHHHASFAYPA